MDTNPIDKISRTSFDETFEILFGEEQTINSGTSKVMFNQKQALLKNRATGEVFQTNVFSSDEDFGELMVIEKYCFIE